MNPLPPELEGKESRLREGLQAAGRLLVAFSGGVDSSYLAYAAHRVLGDDALAVTAESPSYPLSHREMAIRVAADFGIPHRFVSTREMESSDYRANRPDRCYLCNFKYEIDSDKCIYCDWCIKAKPRPECILRVKKLNYDEDGRIVGWEEAEGTDDTLMVWINQYDCIRCGACVQACPVDAISVQKADLETAPACGRGVSV